MSSRDYYWIPITVLFPESMWNWVKLEAWKLNEPSSDFICDVIHRFFSKKYSIERSLKLYTLDFADIETKGHQVKLPPEILNRLNQITIDLRKYRSTIICSICYRYMK